MTKVDPRLPSGFFELLPSQQIQFQRMLDIIRSSYESFGFMPIETPAIEHSEVLLAKGGGDTEKQIYRFEKGSNDLALHYDLTVPVARYVAQHQHELAFPFKRYQLQKVWRAEKAQRGRFREFYQCDADVIGDVSSQTEGEIVGLIYFTFRNLEIGEVLIRINNRLILNGILQELGLQDRFAELVSILDKYDKRGPAGVESMLNDAGLRAEQVSLLLSYVEIKGTADEVMEKLSALEMENDTLSAGLESISEVADVLESLQVPQSAYVFDMAITRGLDYYTGTVFETEMVEHPEFGSVCSGGRYDNLCGYFTDRALAGVGMSIGLTRLFAQLQKVQDFPQTAITDLLVISVSQQQQLKAYELAANLRSRGINVETYSEDEKIGKQMRYADRLGIPFTVVLGEDELKSGQISVRDMASGDEHSFAIDATDEIGSLIRS